MNGMAASGKIFRLLDLPLPEKKSLACPHGDIVCENLSYSYEPEREILLGIDLSFPVGSFTAIVGESGCGKSTVASILVGRNKGYAVLVRQPGEESQSVGYTKVILLCPFVLMVALVTMIF